MSRIKAHNESTKETYTSNPDIKTELSKHNFHTVSCPLRADTEKLLASRIRGPKDLGTKEKWTIYTIAIHKNRR